MLSVLCCDDNKEHLELLKQAFSEIRVGEALNTEFFLGYTQLGNYVAEKGQTVDVILCPVKPGQEDGLWTLYEIKYWFPNIQVIFMSAAAEMCEVTYAVEHIYFLHKPVRLAALREALGIAAREVRSHRPHYLSVREKGRLRTIDSSNILYVESRVREVLIIENCTESVVYNRINDLAKQLDERFIACHKSYIVNLEKVQTLDPLQCTLCNGTRIPISRARFEETKNRFYTLRASIKYGQGQRS